MYSHNAGHYYVGDQPQQQHGTSSGRSTPVHGIGGYGYYQQNRAVSPVPQGMSQQYSNVQQHDSGRTTSGGSQQSGSGVYHASGGYSSGRWRPPHHLACGAVSRRARSAQQQSLHRSLSASQPRHFSWLLFPPPPPSLRDRFRIALSDSRNCWRRAPSPGKEDGELPSPCQRASGSHSMSNGQSI
jgi:hypothetical protein